jgi:hypothetical protein
MRRGSQTSNPDVCATRGGNWDYNLISNTVGTQAQAQADADKINNAVGFGPGSRPGDTLTPAPHAPYATAVLVDQNLQTYAVEIVGAHNDTLNMNSGLLGIVGHGVWDVGVGTLVQSYGGSLGCHN